MEIRKEKSFPRGGRKPAFFKSNKNSTFSFLRKPKIKSRKKNKVKKSEKFKIKVKSQTTSVAGFTTKFVEDLKTSAVQDGMLVLGIVSSIADTIVQVSLPGGQRGAVEVAKVSEFYSNLLEDSTWNTEVPGLRDIFQVGDVLPFKVLAASETHNSLMLTSDPKLINEKLSYNLIENGLILLGSVKSEEEHGLVIDFGIEHVQSFLKYDKIEPNQALTVGQLVRCCVIMCNTSPGSCSVQLSTLKNDLQSACIKQYSALPLYSFIPGFQFEVFVKKILSNGVEVGYRREDSFKGFIHENYLLKKFSGTKDIVVGDKIIATLLYVKPLVNFLFFKVMPKKDLIWPFNFGEIVSGKVMNVKRNGVTFKVIEGSRKAKCFVPISKLKEGQRLLENSTENSADLRNLYPLNKKVSKIRLGQVDWMSRYYVGATDKASLQEKYYSITDLKCGEIVPCKIVGFGKSTVQVEIGRTIKGGIAFTDMTDVPMLNPATKFKEGQKIKARVIDILPDHVFVRLTMKPTLMKEKEILCDVNKCKKNDCYIGTVFKVMDSKIILIFFNSIFGMIPKHLTNYPDSKSLKEHFIKGQLVKCRVIDCSNMRNLLLSMSLNDTNAELIVGKKYEVEVITKTDKGLFLEVEVSENKKCTGYLPGTLLTVHQTLNPALQATYFPGEKLSAYCVSNNIEKEASIFGTEEVFRDIFEGNSEEELRKLLTTESVIPFLFRNKNPRTQTSYLRSIIPGTENHTVIVSRSDVSKTHKFLKYQLVYGKILSVRGTKIEVSTKLKDVWKKDFEVSLSFLDSYLSTMTSLVLRQKEKLNAYNDELRLGQAVEGVIEEVKPGHAIVRLESGDLAIAKGKFETGQEVGGMIIWFDVKEQLLHVKVREKSLNKKPKKKPSGRENVNAQGKVLFISEEAIILLLLGRKAGELAFFPRRRHINDVEQNEILIEVGEIMKLWVTRKDTKYFLAMDRKVVSLQEKMIWKKCERKLKESVESLKRKLNSEKLERLRQQTEPESDEVEVLDVKLRDGSGPWNGELVALPEVKEEKDTDEEMFTCPNSGVPQLEYDNVDIKSEADADEVEKRKPSIAEKLRNEERIPLSSSSESEDEEENQNEKSTPFKVDFDWEVLNNKSLLSGVVFNKEESSSEDEDDESTHDKKKRRRLTGLERKEKAKSEEERLRAIEERLMDTEREPESVDDFDRAVLGNPNSSALWLKYMAFHIQGTEIEKAKAVARRALKAISFREEQEKLNIWIALLNLENMYGNEESLNKTLNEALEVNEQYKIHLHMLTMHGQSNRLQEMERLGNFMLRKYKKNDNLWCDVAASYFVVGKVESARNVLQKALAIVQKSLHVPLISKFAQLENRYGSQERAQTLYESILASYPKRVDIWSCYVDMLIKSNHIDLARQVLERATSQSLRPRKMKTLFKKFLSFEEAHGTPENVEKVRKAAVEYVETVGLTDV